MITLRDVSKIYSDADVRVAALSGIDLHIEASQLVIVMGPSGSGKSTLLTLLGALDSPTSGEISIDGKDITRLDDDALTTFRRQRIGLVFQFFNLLPTLNVFDNVLLPIQMERRADAAERARADRLLEEVGLAGRARSLVYQLSGGEMQRVAIARALIRQPRILLADEPTGNLDSVTGEAILQLLRQTREQRGTTIVMVTHDEAAARIADRVVRLKDGHIAGNEVAERGAVSGFAEPREMARSKFG